MRDVLSVLLNVSLLSPLTLHHTHPDVWQPAEAVRNMSESKRLLEEARKELEENRERAQLRAKHTFSRLPGFFPRKVEMKAIERVLDGEPTFTILFGASSVGKVIHVSYLYQARLLIDVRLLSCARCSRANNTMFCTLTSEFLDSLISRVST